MKRLESMKETLMSCVQGQMGDLSSVDTKELGEAIDMIKDLSEAIYYCTITKAMEENEKDEKHVMYYPIRDMDRDMGRMYYEDGGGDRRNYEGGSSNGGGNYAYVRGADGSHQSRGESRNYSEREYPVEIRDYREGRSPMSRRNYMESKELHKDKAAQLQELDKYMQELAHDVTEMVHDASLEEKQLLQKKLSALATKVV
jgi:hypothetical protein